MESLKMTSVEQLKSYLLFIYFCTQTLFIYLFILFITHKILGLNSSSLDYGFALEDLSPIPLIPFPLKPLIYLFI